MRTPAEHRDPRTIPTGAVNGRGLADRAQVKHHLHRRVHGQEIIQFVRRNDARRWVFGEVTPLAVATQGINDDGFMPAPKQFGLQVGADEAGAASYQDHGRAIYVSEGGRESRHSNRRPA